MVIVGQKIKALRKKKKMTQTELGNKIGVTVGSIALYESDSTDISLRRLEQIAKVFNVEIGYFFRKDKTG